MEPVSERLSHSEAEASEANKKFSTRDKGTIRSNRIMHGRRPFISGCACNHKFNTSPSNDRQRYANNNKMSRETWRRRVSIMSETVFPGISRHDGPGLESKIVSSLPLQMSLYFSIYFFPVWLTTTTLMMVSKFECLTSLYKFIAITVHMASTGIEILRIYLGYLGNLTEKIPEVAGFWMLSVLLQLPLQIFLIASNQLLLKPIEYTVQGIMIILLLSQLIIGYFALRLAARHQARKFHLLRLQKEKKLEVNLGFDSTQ